MSGFARDAVAMVLARGLSLGFSLATAIVTARYLGPDGRGAFFLALTWGAIASQVGSFGSPATVAWLRRHHEVNAGELIATSACQALVGGGLATLLLVGGASALGVGGPRQLAMWPAIALIAIGMLLLQLVSSLLVADGKVGRYNIIQVATSAVTAGSASVAAIMYREPVPVAYVAAFSGLVIAIGAALAAWHPFSDRLQVNPALLRLGAGFSGRIFATSVASFAAQRVSAIVLATVSTQEQVGYFSIASQISDAIATVPATIGALLYPRLISKQRPNWNQARHTMVWTCASVAAIAVAIGVVAPTLLHFLFGERFDAAAAVTRHILLATVLLSACTIVSQFIAASGAPLGAVVPWLGSTIVAIVYCATAAPISGATAAADSQVAASACALLGLILIAYSLRRAA